MARFTVVIPREDGGVEVYPMKEWLRQHPEHVPPNLDASASTSHELRNGLRRNGWSIQADEKEVRLIMPGGENIEATVEAVLGAEESSVDTDPEVAFGYESQLRDFLAQNLGSTPVEGKRLHLFVDPAGNDGVEYRTDVGQIDILTVDDTGDFVVFELKRARSPDHAIGQLTRYMGWVQRTLSSGRAVRGVVVAKTISESLRYAVSVIPNVSLFEYEVSFKLNPVAKI